MGSLAFEVPPSWDEVRAAAWPRLGSVWLSLGIWLCCWGIMKTLVRQNKSRFPVKMSDVCCWSISWQEAAPGYLELFFLSHLILAVVPGVFVVVS